MFLLFCTVCTIMLIDAMIFNNNGIFEERTLQTLYRLKPVYFEQIPIGLVLIFLGKLTQCRSCCVYQYIGNSHCILLKSFMEIESSFHSEFLYNKVG
uniref:Uncharacterized protein n=1 Tax=Meloidogyne enterolobii TaxID=390850 RepID=A0A6V7VWU0_MELEN|nr:unnamed protein product [Meloidogyne enterolobii]